MPNATPNFDFFLPLVDDPTDQDLWGGYLNANFSSLDSLLLGLPPTGTLLDYVGPAAPTGFLLCFGQAVSRTTYSVLFALIGTTFGVGDGSTTFNIPDLRGRATAGLDNMGGSAANRLTSAVSGITSTALGSVGGNQNLHQHNHTITDPGHTHSSNAATTVIGSTNATGGGTNFTSATISPNTTGISINNAGSGASQNVQPTMVVNKIIKT